MALSWGTFAAMLIGAASVRPTIADDCRNVVSKQNQYDKSVAQRLPSVACNGAATVFVTPSPPGTITKEAAVAMFVATMRTFDGGADGGTLTFAATKRNYAQIGAVAGWPDLTDKALSQLLVRAGCRRIHPSAPGYASYGYSGRPVLIEFPSLEEATQ